MAETTDRAEDLLDALEAAVVGEVRRDEPLAALTTLRVGGPAAALVTAESPEDLATVARVCAEHGRPWLIIGKGSNLLIADGGWPGVAVQLGKAFKGVDIDGEVVEAGGAEPMPGLATKVAREGLAGLAFGIAIPGTVGGAVRMNAGAHGGELSEVLRWAEVARLSRGGEIERIPAADLGMRYRHTELPADAVVVRAQLRLTRASAEEIDAAMAEMRRWRREHQPLSEPSCGSVFRNPDGDSAGRLIDLAGMKDHRVGGARVSPKHANFITVDDGGRAADVRQVILDVQEAVRRLHGVDLVTEVVLAGFDEPTDVLERDAG
jgi:UDP-N-acetylmuramate dehydrogenase